MQSPQIPESGKLSFTAQARTRWSDEDNQGVLNNAVFMTLFEEARYKYFSSLGLLSHNQFPFLLAQTNVSFLAPGRGGVEVAIECGTTAIGTTSFTQCYRVRSLSDGVVWCEAESRLVCYDPASGEKRSILPEFRARMAQREKL